MEGFRLLGGRLAEHSSSERVVRSFCPACGTAISYTHEARSARVDVALGHALSMKAIHGAKPKA